MRDFKRVLSVLGDRIDDLYEDHFPVPFFYQVMTKEKFEEVGWINWSFLDDKNQPVNLHDDPDYVQKLNDGKYLGGSGIARFFIMDDFVEGWDYLTYLLKKHGFDKAKAYEKMTEYVNEKAKSHEN